MDNNLNDQLLTMQSSIDDDRQSSDYKMKTYECKIDKLTEMIKQMMDQNKNYNPLPDKMVLPNTQDPTTMVTANKKTPPLEGGNNNKLVACRLSNMILYH